MTRIYDDLYDKDGNLLFAAGSNGFSGARVSVGSGQSIATVTDTVIQFAAPVIYDTHSYFNDASDRFDITEDGYYFIHGLLNLGVSDQKRTYVRIRKNGSTVLQAAGGYSSVTTGYIRTTVVDLVFLEAGDYVELIAYHDEGSNVTLSSAEFGIAKVWSSGNQLTFVGAKAIGGATAQSIPNATFTTLLFEAEEYDTDDIHDNVTNTGRLTINTAGYYLISAQVSWASNTSGERQIYILKNGTTALAYTDHQATAGNDLFNAIAPVYLEASDYIEFQVYQSSGGSLNVDFEDGSGDPVTFFAVHMLGQANHSHAAQADTDWHVVGAAGEPAFANGWTGSNVKFRKTAENMVVLRGLATAGTFGQYTDIFILPAGYRPANESYFVCMSNYKQQARCTIETDGTVSVDSGTGTASVNAIFDGITFFAEQ